MQTSTDEKELTHQICLMESIDLDKKNGCLKVEDRFFGKRKPSVILKRIHRKISLLESQKEFAKLNQERASSAVPSKTRNTVSSLQETKIENLHRSIKESTNESEKQRASTAPENLSTSSINLDPWPTKDEFICLIFRMI